MRWRLGTGSGLGGFSWVGTVQGVALGLPLSRVPHWEAHLGVALGRVPLSPPQALVWPSSPTPGLW